MPQMPIMGGIEATRLISRRKTGRHPIPKVVFVTAHALDSFEKECYEAGGCDFIPKPCKLEDLRASFQRVLCTDHKKTE